jgi:hypothetical protein
MYIFRPVNFSKEINNIYIEIRILPQNEERNLHVVNKDHFMVSSKILAV